MIVSNRRVVLAYSGGIDSTAAVDILLAQGYDVTAMMLSVVEGDEQSVKSARARAVESGVEFELIDCRELFQREVIDNFVAEYIAGRTPAPCTRCNPLIKWRLLAEYAHKIGAAHIATGHYFSVKEYNGKYYVARARDPRKDQSYYLWGLSQEVLRMALTPMADRIKEEVKATSPIKKESMGICFLRGCHYSTLIESHGGHIERGDILSREGGKVGEHRGLAYYTIGQKRGEGIPAGLAVIEIDAERNLLVVGENQYLYRSELIIENCNIVDSEELLSATDITVVVRGLGLNPEGYATVSEGASKGVYIIHLSHPAWACAEGQPVVLYRGDRVIGGGYLAFCEG